MTEPSPPAQPRSVFTSTLLALVPLALAGLGVLFLKWNQPGDLTAPHQTAQPAGPVVGNDTPLATTPQEIQKMWARQDPPPVSTGCVGSAACRDCHAEIHDKYVRTGMGQSFGRIGEVAPLEQRADTGFQAAGRQYHIESSNGQTLHCEALTDDQPGAIYEQKVPIQYAMGSGHKGRSYLFEQGGALFMSPISGYAEGDRVDLSPGYKPEQGDRFERRITSRCLSCHVGQVNAVPGRLDHGGSPAFHELSIGCERCHGPGERHVALHQGDWQAGQTDPIVNPSRLEPELREAVCNQCHLLGADEIPRYQRSDYDFRPGMYLSEVWSLFLEPAMTNVDGTPRAVSQVEQMRDSRCFRVSNGKLGCVSCHDPHASVPEAEAESYYRNRCLECHSQQGCALPEPQRAVKNDSCIACHMPRVGDNDIPHVSQTNHTIPRSVDVELTPISRSRRQAELFQDGPLLPKPDVQRARGIAAAKQAELKQNDELAGTALQMLEPVVAANPLDTAATAALARCYQLIGRFRDAGPIWRDVVAGDPNNEEALLTMAQILQQTGQWKESLDFLEAFLKLNEWPAHAHGMKAQLCERLGELDTALQAAEIAFQRDPTRKTAYIWLEQSCLKAGRTADAERYRLLRERLERALPETQSSSPPGEQATTPNPTATDAGNRGQP
ncbi:MAG: tetratricopeptide repeat protein [Planctomycetaceae bacterium]